MRSALALLALGLAAVLAQGGLARLLPGFALPDLSLLAALAVAATLEPASGLAVAAAIGLGSDMVGSPLLGQLALLRTLEYTLMRAVAGQLDLRRSLPLTVFTFAVVLLDGVAQAGLCQMLLRDFPLHPADAWALLGRAIVTAPLAPLAASLAGRVRRRLEESEARRDLRLETRRPVLR